MAAVLPRPVRGMCGFCRFLSLVFVIYFFPLLFRGCFLFVMFGVVCWRRFLCLGIVGNSFFISLVFCFHSGFYGIFKGVWSHFGLSKPGVVYFNSIGLHTFFPEIISYRTKT